MELLKKSILLLFIVLTTYLNLHAQTTDKDNYALLWEISGNGLAKNSYLFGTMHVRDRRAFEFSDSVLIYLDRADIFASEIHPDSLISGRWSNVYFNEGNISVAEVLNDSSKLGIDVLKYKRPLLLRSLLSRSRPQDDDMPTFVDAYLFNIARNQHKATYGLESIEEQFGISYEEEYLIEPNYSFNFLFQSRKAYDMIDLYQQGNIYEIDTVMSTTMTESYRYILLTKRNINMANRMEKHMRNGSAFVAVGTAHLPGKDGVIQLLRDKGYTLRKVSPVFDHHIAKNYSPKTQEKKWHTFENKQYGYRLLMPSSPHSTIEKAGHFKIHQYPDVGTNNVYTTYCLDYSKLDGEFSEKELERKIIISLLQSADSNKFEGKKNLELEHRIKTTEVKIKKADGRYFRLRLYYPPNKVIVQLFTSAEENLYGEDANYYFDSFEVIPTHSTALTNTQTYPVTSKSGAFKITFPRNPMHVLTSEDIPKNEDEYTYKYHLYTNQNLATRNEFTVRYNDNPLGHVNRNDSLVITEGKVQHFWFGKDTSYQVSKRGYPGKSFSYRDGKVKEQVYVRGNRVYSISAKLYDKQDSLTFENFFNTFEFTDYQKQDYITYQAELDGFVSRFPQEPELSKDSLISGYYEYDGVDYLTEYRARDDNNGNAFYIWVSQLSDYYYVPNKDSLFSELYYTYANADDSLLMNHDFEQQGLIGKDYLIAQANVNALLRLRIFLINRKVVVLAAYLAKETLADEQTEAFFTDFHWALDPETSVETDLFEPKASQLLSDIKSTDSATAFKALKALSFFQFGEEHLDKISVAINQSYPDDERQYGSIRSRLIGLIAGTGSPNTIRLLEDSFVSVEGYPNLQLDVLEELSAINSETSRAAFFKLAQQLEHADLLDTDYLFDPYFDSLALAKNHYEELLGLAKLGKFQGDIFRLTSKLIQEDSSNLEFLAPYQADYKSMLAGMMEVYQSKTDDMAKERALHILPDLIELLENFEQADDFIALMKEIIEIDEPSLQEKAAYILLASGQKVNKRTLEDLQQHLPSWYNLLKKLHHNHLLKVLPEKYLSQTNIAKAAFHRYVAAKRRSPEIIEFIKKEKVRYRGKDVIIYVYKFKYDVDSDSWFLGISGPQPINSKQYDFSNEFTSVSWQEYDENLLETQVNRLVYQLRYR